MAGVTVQFCVEYSSPHASACLQCNEERSRRPRQAAPAPAGQTRMPMPCFYYPPACSWRRQAGQATAGPTFAMHLATWAWSTTIRLEQHTPLVHPLSGQGQAHSPGYGTFALWVRVPSNRYTSESTAPPRLLLALPVAPKGGGDPALPAGGGEFDGWNRVAENFREL